MAHLLMALAMLLSIIGMSGTQPATAISEQGILHAKAPVNPEFLEFMRNLNNGIGQEKDGKIDQGIDGEYNKDRRLGYIPSPLKRARKAPITSVNAPAVLMTVDLPSSFDLRNVDGSQTGTSDILQYVTSVKNQGSSGSCWTFATFGSLESFLLKHRGQEYDFSENNMKNTHGFDFEANSGGNGSMATAYLARWSGPVNESLDTYNPISTTSTTGLPEMFHVQNVSFIPPEVNAVKQAVYEYGAIYTAFHYAGEYFNDSTDAYYCPTDNPANHAVTIVGWKDAYPASSFHTNPGINGAFIVKNSWGENWGDKGYFYLSYADASSLSENVAFHDAGALDNYDSMYSYDPLGATSAVGYGTNTCWGANLFTAQTDEVLNAVSFYTPTENAQYEVVIRTNVIKNPSEGIEVARMKGVIGTEGYHTITLDKSVTLAAGQKFAVLLNMIASESSYPLMIESPIAGYSSKATAGVGESFISSNGSSWSDITRLGGFRNTNVCIKAFTDMTGNDEPVPTPTPKPTAIPTPTPEPTEIPTPTPTPEMIADLTVTSVSAPTKVAIGRKVNLTASVNNVGTAMANTFNVEFVLSSDGMLDSDEVSLGVKQVNGLAASASTTVSLTVPIPTVPKGTWYVIVKADSGNTVVETDDSNNWLSGKSMTIK